MVNVCDVVSLFIILSFTNFADSGTFPKYNNPPEYSPLLCGDRNDEESSSSPTHNSIKHVPSGDQKNHYDSRI